MAVIFFSSHLPSLEAPEAGQKICLFHLNKLSESNTVHVVSFVNTQESPYFNPREFQKYASAKFFKLSNTRRALNWARNLYLPIEVAIRADSRVDKHVKKLIGDFSPSEIYMEYEQAAYIIREIETATKKTLVLHDVMSQSLERRMQKARKYSLRKIFLKFQLSMTKAWEKDIFKKVDTIIVLNDKDRALLHEMGTPQRKIQTEPPIVSNSFLRASREKFDWATILFWGAMNRTENEDAVLWFIARIFPKIRIAVPEARFVVLGAKPSKRLTDIACASVSVTGYVEDPIPYFENACLMVAPLRLGAGIKIKVLEAMAARLPVVGTSVATEGIDDPNHLLTTVDDPNDFADRVIRKLRSFRNNNSPS